MPSPMFYEAFNTISKDEIVRSVFEEAMRQTGKTGWAVSRAIVPTKHTSSTIVEQALKTLQDKHVLNSTGGTGLSGYYSATPMAFEIKETLR